MTEDHLYKCEVMFPRLQAQGYTGGLSTIKAYVQTLRPAKVGQYPIQRYATKPGEQMQYDWGNSSTRRKAKTTHSMALWPSWDILACAVSRV
jgi:transposase